jgi:hypothetical protein
LASTKARLDRDRANKRIKAAIQMWDSYGVNTDRRWLERVIEALFSTGGDHRLS